jgi:BASS family bile acid:Na+ symporter
MLLAFGMGLGLTLRDFANVTTRPTGVITGSASQIVLMPAVAVAIASLVDDPIVIGGLLLIAVCPGGATSNYFTYLARGDVALSITLTAISGSLAALTVPLVFNAAMARLVGRSVDVFLPFWQTMRSILLFLVVPVIVGMIVKRCWSAWAERSQAKVATGGFIILLILTPLMVGEQFRQLANVIVPAFVWCGVFIPTMMGLGLVLSRLVRLPPAQRRALPIEVGVQNVALAIFLALTFLEDPRYTAVPVAYLILMFVFVPGYVVAARRDASCTSAHRSHG